MSEKENILQFPVFTATSGDQKNKDAKEVPIIDLVVVRQKKERRERIKAANDAVLAAEAREFLRNHSERSKLVDISALDEIRKTMPYVLLRERVRSILLNPEKNNFDILRTKALFHVFILESNQKNQ